VTPIEAEFRALIAAALAYHCAGKLSEAEGAYRAALNRHPGHPAVLHNLGALEAERGRTRSAIDLFDQAIAREPSYASAHYNRAVALQALGRTQEAIRGYSRACAIEPDNYAAHRAVAFLWLAEGERGRALDHFARTYELRRGDDRTGLAARSLTHSTRGKLRHDSEQFGYLAAGRRDARRFETLARLYRTAAEGFPEEVTELSADHLDMIGEDYNTAIHIREAPELAASAVADRPDRGVIAQRFHGDRPATVTIDNMLTPAALDGLRLYLLESTIWHDFTHIRGFVAAYLEDGLACPLLLQIADELRAALPEVLGPHPLTQAWAFKALDSDAAIDAHADDGAVSINLWLTPNGANRNPERGGLTVCRAVPSAKRPVAGYEADRDRLVAFLERNAAEAISIPYEENRAVLFESRLVHGSDKPIFEEGYENHRINLTLVFRGPAGDEYASSGIATPDAAEEGPKAQYQN
jgi:tetratricopeptide (TPR) repeat protein